MPQNHPGETQPAITATLRNEPVQARSTARLTRLLDAAAEVIDEIGFERLTTAMVAERAGASIGTVYRYFPDRIAVLQSLSVRATSEFVDEVGTGIRDEAHSTWLEAIDAVLELFEKSFTSKRGFRSLRFGDVIDLRPAESSSANTAIVAEAIADALNSRFGVNTPDLAFHIEVALRLVDGLLARAYAVEDAGDSRFSSAGKSVARSYLIEQLGEPA